jgi:uncharacterized membrane protein (UPF0127 family)
LNRSVLLAVLLILITGTVYGGYLLLRPPATSSAVFVTTLVETTSSATRVIAVTSAVTSTITSSQIVLDGVNLSVEIASTPEAQQKGLSGRDPLPLNHGMLFVFSSEGTYGFWMPDMKFSLDIIWFNAQLQVVYIQQNLPPCPPAPQTCPIYTPPVNALYVLEVDAGFVQAHNVSIGDTFNFVG